ncbi:hypothetical protein B0O99DRAFT_738318 [Bisporella sp. PMI_857]|nr:hypothetical protein B0O99DRAFT_738318 [Bisporella sp. PMI_857]
MKFVIGLMLVLGAAASPAPRDDFNWRDIDFVLAFGDSYTYVQGTFGHQNYSFIGDALNYSFTPTQLLSNKIIQDQTGTSAGGPNWVEFLTGCFSGLPSKCRTQLWDFAFAGADISTSYMPLHHDYTIPFVDQIKQYTTYAHPVLYPRRSNPNPKKSLVALWIGINDINDSAKYTFPRNGTSNFAEYYDLLIAEMFESLENLYSAGYRNFLVVGLPNLDQSPANQKTSTPLPNLSMIQSFNGLLANRSKAFQSTHRGTKNLVFDTHAYLSSIFANASTYGITNTTSFCPRYNAPDIAANYAAYGCSAPDAYFWYNSGHITSHVHRILAKEVDSFLREQSSGRH